MRRAPSSFIRRACVGLHGLLALLYLYRFTDIARRTEVLATDFVVFFTGWSLIVAKQGRALYDVAAQRQMQQAIVYPHAFHEGLIAFLNPPHAALLLSPLAWLDVQVAFYLWTAGQLVLLSLLARRLLRLCAIERPLDAAVLLTALLAFWPVFYTLYIGQLSILLAFAFMELFAALEAGRPRRAAWWLLVLSFKPQLLPFPLLLLLVRRDRDVLRWAFAFGLAAVAATSAILGPSIWPDYFRQLGRLEPFFGDGVPRFMTNVRGAVASLTGGDDRLAARVAWSALACALAMAYLWWRRTARVRAAPVKGGGVGFDLLFAQATALSLLFSPHLFMQDMLSWVIPLALFYRHQRRSPAVARFALCWPIVFAVSVVLDNVAARGRLFNLSLAMAAALAIWLFRASRRAVPSPVS